MVSKSYLDGFIPVGAEHDKCIKCGICLQNCPVMKMEQEEAKAEIIRLINGEKTERVLDECSFCFTCNHYCPNGLNPYSLIMERMAEHNSKCNAELPPFVTYMINGRNEPGYFNEQYEESSDEHKAVIKKWSKIPSQTKDLLFIGCAGRTAPLDIEKSKVLENLPKYGPRDICCGDLAYRFGDYQAFSEIAEKAFNQLSSLKIDLLVCYCASCSNYFGNIWPNCHGLKLPFEVISLHEWLWEKYQEGLLSIKNKTEQDIVISDSCHAGELGDHFMDSLRGLYKAAGMNVVELKNSRHDSLCCGVGSMLRCGNGQPDISADINRKMEQILDTGVYDVTSDCHGCVVNLGQAAEESNVKIHHAVDIILKAFGG